MGNRLIYKHTLPNRKSYIGQTSDLARRNSAHRLSTGCRLFAAAIRKYGWESVKTEILAQGLTLEQANDLEARLIDEHSTLVPNGYNLATGGGNSRPTADARRRMSEAAKNRPPMTDEAKAKLVTALKSRGPVSAETRAKQAAAATGKKPSPETLAKLKGRRMSDEARAKMAAAKRGRKQDPAHSSKIRAKTAGQRRSPETRERMRAAQQQRRANEKGPPDRNPTTPSPADPPVRPKLTHSKAGRGSQ